MAETRDLITAQHEAAHIVVGVAVGLTLRRASIVRQSFRGDPFDTLGYAWFQGRARGEAWALMFAAGVAWDRGLRTRGTSHSYDAIQARKLCYSRHDYLAILKASAALLSCLTAPHARVTRALLQRDITARDIAAMAHGEDIE